MGAKYAANATNTSTASTTVPMFNLTGGTTKRVRLYHILIGSVAAPANQANQFALRRSSARGTSSGAFVAIATDPADAAAAAVFDTAWAVNPTITASSDMLNFSMNQQASVQWMVDPSFGIVIPATSGAGLPFMAVATTAAAAHQFNVFFEE